MSLLTSRRLSTLSSLFRWSKSSSEKDRLESDDVRVIIHVSFFPLLCAPQSPLGAASCREKLNASMAK